MAECRGSIDGCHRRKKKSHPAEIAFWCRSHHKNPSLWSLASQLVLKTLFDSFLSWFFKFRQNSQQFWQSIYHLSQSPRKKSQIYAVPGPSGFTAFFLFFPHNKNGTYLGCSSDNSTNKLTKHVFRQQFDDFGQTCEIKRWFREIINRLTWRWKWLSAAVLIAAEKPHIRIKSTGGFFQC